MKNLLKDAQRLAIENQKMIEALSKENNGLVKENLELKEKIALLEAIKSNVKKTIKKVRITKNKSHKQNITLLQKFAQKSPIRPITEHILIKDGTMITTNFDSTLYIKDNNELDAGMYLSENLKNNIVSKLKFDIEEYPNIKTTLDIYNEGFTINSKRLLKAINKVLFAAATSTENLALNCVFIESDLDKINFVASDTYRLSFFKENIKSNFEFKASIPLKVIQAVQSDIKGLDTDITFSFNEHKNHLKIEYYNRTIYTRLIEMSFPDYKAIEANMKSDKYFNVNTELLIENLKKNMIVSKKKQESEFSSLYTFENNNLSIKSVNEKSEVITSVDTISEHKELFRMSLNDKYMSDFLKVLDNSTVCFETYNSSSAVIAREENLYFVQMPLALRDL